MSEATPEATQQTPAEPKEARSDGQQATSTSTPPWGDDFDAQTAWDRLQKVQREAQNLRQRQMTDEQRQQLDEYRRFQEASKSEAQRQSEALEAANRARDTAQADALRYRVAAEHGIGRDDLDLLGSGTEEELVARAERITTLRTPATAPELPQPTPGQRPVEHLRPGATPSGANKSEDQLNYERLFGPEAR